MSIICRNVQCQHLFWPENEQGPAEHKVTQIIGESGLFLICQELRSKLAQEHGSQNQR